MLDFENIKKFDAWRERWGDKDSITLWQYVNFNVHPEDILILGSLMFPNFIEIDGCVLLSSNYDEDVFKEMQLNYDNQMIEKNINHVRIYDVFANCVDDVDDLVFERIGKLLQFSWSGYLRQKFPDRKIIVTYLNDEQEYSPTLSVYQE